MLAEGIVQDPHLPVVYIRGMAVPTGKRGVTAVEIIEGIKTELDMAYEGNDPAKIGLTKKQAMDKSLADKAADGDLNAISMIHDRIAGKAVQQVQSVNVTSSLKEFLNSLSQASAQPDVMPVEVVPGGTEQTQPV